MQILNGKIRFGDHLLNNGCLANRLPCSNDYHVNTVFRGHVCLLERN